MKGIVDFCCRIRSRRASKCTWIQYICLVIIPILAFFLCIFHATGILRSISDHIEEKNIYFSGNDITASRIIHSINFSVNPCDDFYEFACGNWIADHPVPPHSSKVSQYSLQEERVEKFVAKILRQPRKSSDSKPLIQAREFYKSCMNNESENLNDALQIFDSYGGWPIILNGDWNSSAFDWLRLVSDLQRNLSTSVLFKLSVTHSRDGVSPNSIHLATPEFNMHSVYFKNVEKYSDIANAYKTYMRELALQVSDLRELLGYAVDTKDIEERTNEIFEFERTLAISKSKSGEETYKSLKLYELEEYFDNITETNGLNYTVPWIYIIEEIFRPTGLNVTLNESISISDEAYFIKLSTLLANTTEETLANYLQFRLISKLLWRLSEETRKSFAKFSQSVSGITQTDNMSNMCMDETVDYFGWALSQKYIEYYFYKHTKHGIETLRKKMLLSFKDLMHASKWINAKDKTEYYHKRANWIEYQICIAFPDWLTNTTLVEKYYEDLEFGKGTFVEKYVQARTWSAVVKLKQLREKFSFSCYWHDNPSTVNALFDPSRYNIEFPAAILQRPFYDTDLPAYLNYGSIGFIIGHEISHAFDTDGWTTLDSGEDTPRKECLINQYNQYNLRQWGVDAHINGNKTFGENFADNGGIREAFWAYKKHQQLYDPDPIIHGLEMFNPEKLFFLAYAQTMCESNRPEGIRHAHLTGNYSPGKYRIMGPLMNFEEFSAVWNCPVGSRMNPDPTKVEKCSPF